MRGFESVSSWSAPQPPPASTARTELVDDLAARIARLSPDRLRVAVDGFTAAGKTSFGHELAAAIRELGRPTLRASLDDFKHPGTRPASSATTGSAARATTAMPTTSPPLVSCFFARRDPRVQGRWLFARTIR